MRTTKANAPINYLHAHDNTRVKATLPDALNAQLMPASRLLPESQTASDEELTPIIENGLEPGVLHELRCRQSRDSGALAGFAFGLLSRMTLRKTKPVLWISAPFADTSNMTLFPQGLANWGFDPARLVLVQPLTFMQALWAADEAAKCTDLAAIVLHIEGHPKALDMTATRRLSLRASESGTTSLILRQSGEEEATAAATRWCIAPHPSHAFRSKPVGAAGQDVGFSAVFSHLERNRQGATSSAPLIWNHQIRGFRHVANQDTDTTQPPSAVPQHSPPGALNRQDKSSIMGQVMAFQNPLERTG
ncbi:MAG: ImuA family protein [Hyphomicrobiales bacterium]